MASATRNFARAAFRSTPSTSAFKTSARNTAFTLPRQTFRQQSRRGYASESTKSSSSGTLLGIGALALAGGAGYYFYSKGTLLSGSAGETRGIFTPKFEDYQKVYNEIAERLEEKDEMHMAMEPVYTDKTSLLMEATSGEGLFSVLLSCFDHRP